MSKEEEGKERIGKDLSKMSKKEKLQVGITPQTIYFCDILFTCPVLMRGYMYNDMLVSSWKTHQHRTHIMTGQCHIGFNN